MDGYIEAIYPYDDPVALICGEEAKLEGKPLNRALRDEDGTLIGYYEKHEYRDPETMPRYDFT